MKPNGVPDGPGRVEAKLTALLAVAVEARQHNLGVKIRLRPIDVLLSDAGMTSKEIGALLGKTDRAVNLVLQANRATRSRDSDKQEE